MTTMLITQNETRESGSFCGDQLCSLKTAYCFLEGQPDVDRVIMSVSPGNEMHFLWTKFIERYNVELVHDDWNAGDWTARWNAWERWRTERRITLDDGSVCDFQHYRELYLRIHGMYRQVTICGSERGIGRKNIYEYWLAGQENMPDAFPDADWFDDTLVHHPLHKPERDVYVSPHAKTQGNIVFTFDFWSDVVHQLVDAGVSVTVGWDCSWFCEDLVGNPLYKVHWGDHRAWMDQICKHRLVACGNTGTGWLAAACGVPMVTMEPHNSVMPDHRFRECGLRNIIEVVDGARLDSMNGDMCRVAHYVARRVAEAIRKCVVMTTGCYDVLHAGHVRHLQRARALGTRLVVALNSDASVRSLKGEGRPINPEDQRKAVLEELRCVDEVRLFDGKDAREMLGMLRPDVLAVGFGYTLDTIVGRDLVESWGGRAVVTCTGDASIEPSTTKIVRSLRGTEMTSVLRTAASYSVNPPQKLRFLAEQFLSVKNLSGDVADLGACRGGTSLILRKLAPDKTIHIFDTWEGTPYDDPLCHHKRGEWPASLKECQQLVGTDQCQGETHFHVGTFPNDIVCLGVLDQQFCFVFVDMDTYQATKDAIEFFWPRMVLGGKILLDDYGWEPCAGVQKAVDEYFNDGRDVKRQHLHKCSVTGYICVLERE